MNRSLLAFTALALAACATPKPPAPPPHAAVGSWGVDFSAMDKSVKPGDNFFDYANGTWLANAKFPENRSYVGVTLDLVLKNEAHLKDILSDLAKRSDDKLNVEERKVRDLYSAYMDEDEIEKKETRTGKS